MRHDISAILEPMLLVFLHMIIISYIVEYEGWNLLAFVYVAAAVAWFSLMIKRAMDMDQLWAPGIKHVVCAAA